MSQDLQQLQDPVVDYVINQAKQWPAIKKILLFGSRARGDKQERSDYDFAVETQGNSHAEWSKFCLLIQDNAPTLCEIDLVWLNETKRLEFLQHINHEGKLIYESNG